MFSFSAALAASPLPAGKPAGVRRAQIATTHGAIFLGAVAVIAVVGYALSTHPYQIPGATAAISTQP